MKKLVRLLGRLIPTRRPCPDDGGELEDLKLRYQEFKHLLRANNEVLSIIADIEGRLITTPTLGINFLQSRYVDSSAKVFKMILGLNRISAEAYPDLYSAFELIRNRIQTTLEEIRRPEDNALVLPLTAINGGLVDLVGSKAANLAAVSSFGLPGRDGFVITAFAFHHFLETTGLRAYLLRELTFLEDYSYHNLAAMSRRIYDKIMATPLPEDLAQTLSQALSDIAARSGQSGLRLSFRSSAVGEDTEASFAGQYKTVLNVTAEQASQAYRQVVASLYEPQAMVYRHRRGWRAEEAEMAVLVLAMLSPLASGVMYTQDPRRTDTAPVLINSVFGLGRGLVEGSVTPDEYLVSRERTPHLLNMTPADKRVRVVTTAEGITEEPLPPDMSLLPTLTPTQAELLASLGLKLEAGFGEPQDIEWSLLGDGSFAILQSRPLQFANHEGEEAAPGELNATTLYGGGETARPGAASGKVYLVLQEDDLDSFPQGGILVTRKSSPVFGCVLDKAAAVITEIGGVTGHMASLAREYGVPTLVGATGFMKLVQQGDLITLDATNRRVYQGNVESVLRKSPQATVLQPALAKGPIRHPVARLITPLTLTNPRSVDFTASKCRTFHDLIRFIHEKSFTEMFRLGDRLGRAARHEARKFSHQLPFELWIIDLGGGLVPDTGVDVPLNRILSTPGLYFFSGLLDRRIHWDQPRPVSLRGLVSVFSGSVLHPDANGSEREFGQKAFAILSPDYLNFNSRVGYHFAALDCVCGPKLNDNYISFRFQGGAATEDRRALRAELIYLILTHLGFEVTQRGDTVHAFIKKYNQVETGSRLAEIGRLTLFTRQMDMLTHDRRMVQWLVQAFESGNYNLESNFQMKPEATDESPQ